MHNRFTSSTLIALVLALILNSHCIADPSNALKFQWTRSLPLESSSKNIGIIGGSEARCLAAMDNKLYAGIGYWMDEAEGNPKLPGAQVLRLDAPNGHWKVDLQLDEMLKGKRAGIRRYMAVAVMKTVRFDTDGNGKPLPNPKQVLLAGVWDKLGKLEVFSKESGQEKWNESTLSEDGDRYAEIRSFGSHRDVLSKIELVFAGTRTNGLDLEPQIYSGAYDTKAGIVRWNSKPEKWIGALSNLARTTRGSARITGFSECNGKLYATVYNTIYERQDGADPSWKPIWKHSPVQAFEEGSSGLRGLTTIANPDAKGEVLMVSLEHKPGILFRVDPHSGIGSPELNISQYLSKVFDTRIGYVIAGYNDMLKYDQTGHKHGVESLLIGIESAAPRLQRNFLKFMPDAHFLVRSPNGTYSVEELVDGSIKPKPHCSRLDR